MAAPAAPRPAPPPLAAAHGAEIVALAATADGLAVASADRLGGIRLWPVLDGTREPVVITGTATRALTLTRDGDGFVIGTLDPAGGVHLIRTSAAGAVRGRTTVAGELPASEIVAIADGLLILRADQALERIDAGGTVRGRLYPDPGTHVDSLVARAGRVLALVQEDKQLHGRWLDLGHGVGWGAGTPRLPFKIAHAVLSPGGELLAVSRPRSLHPALIDLADGTARKAPLCVSKEWPHEGGDDGVDDNELMRSDNAPLPLGFLSDTVVACSVMTALVWWGTDGSQQTNLAGSLAVANLPVAMTDRALVLGAGPNLALAHPSVNRFLGYGVHDLSGLRVSAVGLLAGTDQQWLLFDAGLGERARFEPSRGRGEWLDLAPLDERYAVATLMRRSTDRRDNLIQVAVFDGLSRTLRQLLPYAAQDREVSYEPATRLLATSDGAMAMLLRFDPSSHTFGEPIRVGSAIAPPRIALLDPRRSGGIAALEIDQTPDGLLVGELREAELRPGATVQPRTTYRVPGELRAVDRAGHLYVHRPLDRDDLVVFSRDVPGARLAEVAGLTLRPSADGSRIAAFGSQRLVMLTGTGEVRWERAAWSGGELGWTAAGDLVVQFPSGIARIDLETGRIAARRCGWAFGLSDQMPEAGHPGPSICDMSTTER